MMCTVFGIRKKKIPQSSRREGTIHSPINRAVLSSSQSAVLHGRIYRVSPETAQNRRFPQRPPRAKVVFGYKRISCLGSTSLCRRVRWQTFSSSLNTIPGGGGVLEHLVVITESRNTEILIRSPVVQTPAGAVK